MKYLIPATVLLLSLAGCGRSEDKTITFKDPETGEKVDINVGDAAKGNVTLHTKEGDMVINGGPNATLPAGFETYPGAVVQSSITGNADTGSGAMVTLKTKDAPAQVLAYYKQKFAAKGWKIGMEANTSKGGMITAGGENNGPGAMITANAEGGETIVGVIMGK